MIQSPQGFVVAEECAKATWQSGYRRKLEEVDGWARFGSTTAKGTVWIAATNSSGPWFLSLDHSGVIAELDLPRADIAGPGSACYRLTTLADLYSSLAKIYRLAVSLPDAPLQIYLAKIQDKPQTTEAERLVVQRIGQDVFRQSLLEYWAQRCPLTGIGDKALLRASHIKAWHACGDAERLDVHNGLLLSALWDAAFDRGLVTFEDDGAPRFSPTLSSTGRAALTWQTTLTLTPRHRAYLSWHREKRFGQPMPEPEILPEASLSSNWTG